MILVWQAVVLGLPGFEPRAMPWAKGTTPSGLGGYDKNGPGGYKAGLGERVLENRTHLFLSITAVR